MNDIKTGIVASANTYVSGAAPTTLCSFVPLDGDSGIVTAHFDVRALGLDVGDYRVGYVSSVVHRSGTLSVVDGTMNSVFSTGGSGNTWTCALSGTGANIVAAFTGEIDHVVSASCTMEATTLMQSFDPMSLKPRAYWRADPSDLAYTGQTVTKWQDKTHSGNDLTSVGINTYSTFGKGVYFRGDSDFLATNYIATLTSSYTFTAVYKHSGSMQPSSYSGLFSNFRNLTNGVQIFLFRGGPATVYWLVSHTEPTSLNYVLKVATLTPNVESFIARYTGTQIKMRVGGIDLSAGNINPPLACDNQLRIGSLSGYGFWTGDIYEMAVFERELTESELSKLSAYYTSRYGCV